LCGKHQRIGTLVTHAEIMRSPLIGEMLPALAAAAHTIGAVQTRSATISA